MENIFEFWYLFPISIVIATIAMITGIGGAVFFSPLLMIGLKLEPNIAIGVALITEFFGFSSGVMSYYRSKLIDFSLAKSLLIFSLPLALIGSYFSHSFNPDLLKAIFGLAIIIIGTQIFQASKKHQKTKEVNGKNPETKLTILKDTYGNTYKYEICSPLLGKIFAGIGGFFVGIISVGLAELQEYHLVAKCKIPTPVAIGTSIFVVMITVFGASIGHIYALLEQGSDTYKQVISLIIFTVPGVIIGGQIGPKIQQKLPETLMKKSIAIVFVVLGIFLLGTLGYSYIL